MLLCRFKEIFLLDILLSNNAEKKGMLYLVISIVYIAHVQ